MLCQLEKLLGTGDLLRGFRRCDCSWRPVVASVTRLQRLEKIPMEMGRDKAGASEVLPKGCVHCRMFGKSKPFPQEKGLSHVEHGVVGARGCKAMVALMVKELRCAQTLASICEQIALFLCHTATPSRRTLMRSGLRSLSNCSSETK